MGLANALGNGMADELTTKPASELGRGIAQGAIDPVALTDAYFDAIEAFPDRDAIYARLTKVRARSEAAAARERARTGLLRGPLDGVPISWKDLFDTADVATEAGSRLLAGRVPARDARVLRNATDAGLVCLGKTHTTELAFSGLGLNPMTATPPNAHDHKLLPGGSSSGAAASTALGLAAAGIGSDTGGSVRIPAAWNDLVGLKTTAGHLSLDGVVPLCPTFDTVGPLCRSVEDAGNLLAALSAEKPTDLGGTDIESVSLLICDTVAMDDADEATLSAFERAVSKLSKAGARIRMGSIGAVADALGLSGVLYPTEAYATWGEAIEAQPDLMFAPVRERFLAGKEISGSDYLKAWQKLLNLRKDYARATAGYDAVIVPTAPILPPDRERAETDLDYFTAQNLLALRNTRIGNLLGLCALTLPTSVPSCGIMFLAAPRQERLLLRIGHAAEAALA